MSQVWLINITESTNIFYINDRTPGTIKVNIKERFMGNDGFPQNIYVVNGLQSDNKKPVT